MPIEIVTPINECRLIGEEKETASYTLRGYDIQELVSIYKTSKGKSYRFIALQKGKPIAALQIVSRTKKKGIIANIHTMQPYRRKGIALLLVSLARPQFKTLVFSNDLTNDGKAFKEGIKYRI